MLLARRQLDDGRFRFGEWSFVIVLRNCQFRLEPRVFFFFFFFASDRRIFGLRNHASSFRGRAMLSVIRWLPARPSWIGAIRSRRFFNFGFRRFLWSFLRRINFARICYLYYSLYARVFLGSIYFCLFLWVLLIVLRMCKFYVNFSSHLLDLNFAWVFLVISWT